MTDEKQQAIEDDVFAEGEPEELDEYLEDTGDDEADTVTLSIKINRTLHSKEDVKQLINELVTML